VTKSLTGDVAIAGGSLAGLATREQRRLAIWLALIAGYVDAYALIAYGVYVSFMSGNTTQTGSLIGEGRLLVALPSAVAILFFVVGSFAGTWLTESRFRNSRQIRFSVIAAVLAMIIVGSQLGNQAPHAEIIIAMLGLAMGLLNSRQSHIGPEPVSLTFVTGTLSKGGNHLAMAVRRAPLPDAQGPWDTHLRRAALMASVWAGFLAAGRLSPERRACTSGCGCCCRLSWSCWRWLCSAVAIAPGSTRGTS
jgi:uncharacterized membrane protein YoaK (UPF0700 family)